MRFALNIGMLTSAKVGHPKAVSLSRICLELHAAHILPVTFEIKHPQRVEPTAVFVCSDKRPLGLTSLADRLHHVSVMLEQDCIAVVPLTPSIERGWSYNWAAAQLIGPRSTDWGAFDRAQFIPAEL